MIPIHMLTFGLGMANGVAEICPPTNQGETTFRKCTNH